MLLAETVPVPLQLFDAEGHSVRGNPAFLNVFGRTPPEHGLLQDATRTKR